MFPSFCANCWENYALNFQLFMHNHSLYPYDQMLLNLFHKWSFTLSQMLLKLMHNNSLYYCISCNLALFLKPLIPLSTSFVFEACNSDYYIFFTLRLTSIHIKLFVIYIDLTQLMCPQVWVPLSRWYPFFLSSRSNLPPLLFFHRHALLGVPWLSGYYAQELHNLVGFAR